MSRSLILVFVATCGWLLCVGNSPVLGQTFFRPRQGIPASQLSNVYKPPGATIATDRWAPVPAQRLQRPPGEYYTVDHGDVLAVFIEGVLGDVGQSPPINLPPAGSDLPPSLGFPVAVERDGGISLPSIPRLSVKGLTVPQVQDLVTREFVDGPRPVLASNRRILVSLMRKRTVSVIVLRGDQSQASRRQPTANRIAVNDRSDRSQRGTRLQLPEGDNDVLNALIQTGGLPGVNAEPYVGIQRSQSRSWPAGGPVEGGGRPANHYRGNNRRGRQNENSVFPRSQPAGSTVAKVNGSSGWASRLQAANVPVRQPPGPSADVARSNAQLNNGDVLTVAAQPTQVFYTGGLLAGREFRLPRDRRLDVLEAVSLAGGFNRRNGSGLIPLSDPAELLVVRRQPDGSQITILVDLNAALTDPAQRIAVAAGDLLILQHSPVQRAGNIGIGTLNTIGVRRLFGR